MLDSLRDGLQNAVKKLIGMTNVDEEAVKEFVRDLQRTLIQADVNVKIVLSLTEAVQKRALEEKPIPGVTRKDQVIKILFEELSTLLGGEGSLKFSKDEVSVVLMFGVQGSGKTTTTAKLARLYAKQGLKVGVVAADTFRPGAVTQLKTLCEPFNIEVYSEESERDSVRIAVNGKSHFEENKNLIIIDTAGRHKEEKGLLNEMQKMVSKVKPNLNLLVIDGTIGQACYNQALAFHQASTIGGIVITKLDGAAKGGGALAAAAATGAKIFFIGTGERIDDIEQFSSTRFVGRLLGMGDLKALLDMAKQMELEVDQKRIQRITSGKLTMDDFLYQFEQVKKMGSIRKLIELVPGLSGSLKEDNLEKIEGKIRVWKPIIQSMTKDEKEAPDKINVSRIRRMSRGAGTTEKDARELIAYFRQTKNLMKASKGREFRQMLRRMGGTQ
jgi:signal recognition particle subunit SRP54